MKLNNQKAARSSAVTAAAGSKLAMESHSIDYIPEHERHGTLLRQGLFWFVPNLTIFSVALGVIGPNLGLSLWWTICAGAIGTFVGGIFVSLHATQGPKLGLPQMIQSRAQFGHRGVMIPTLVVLANYLVFNVLQTDVIKSGLSGIFGWSGGVVVVTVSSLAAVIAILGHDWLHVVFRFMFWLCTPLFIVLTIGLAVDAPTVDAVRQTPLSFNTSAFMAVLAAAMGYQLALAPYISDYTRYLPSTSRPGHTVAVVQAAICLSLLWFMGIGAWIAAELGATDVVVGIDKLGDEMLPHLGTVAAVLAVGALIAVIGTNTYSAGIAVITLLDIVRPIRNTRRLRIVVIVVLLALWGTVNLTLQTDQSVLISDLLNIMLCLLAPWSAVNLVDFFLIRRGTYSIAEFFDGDGAYGNWAWRGIAAYGIGLLVELPFAKVSFYQGPIANLMGIDISFAVGLFVAAITFFALSRLFPIATAAPAPTQTTDGTMAIDRPDPGKTASTNPE